jgi:hypothetical protein
MPAARSSFAAGRPRATRTSQPPTCVFDATSGFASISQRSIPHHGSARILDRTGKPLPIPLIATVRDDRDGSRWQSTELALAPLAAGDYLIELSSGEKRTLVAFRVVP